jgi:hypothetical protein
VLGIISPSKACFIAGGFYAPLADDLKKFIEEIAFFTMN